MALNGAPSVLTSEAYNEAETIFGMLQNKEQLISFLDCTTVLRGMGMNPTHTDMDRMQQLMAAPILRLEQWRREEELKKEKARRKEEAKQRKSAARMSVAPTKKTELEKAVEASQAEEKAAKMIPAEEIKNIDWNIFISCAKLIFRDSASEEKAVFRALKIFSDEDRPTTITRDKVAQVVASNGDNVLVADEVRAFVACVPEECSIKELAARIQGTYVPPTKEELERIAMEKLEAELLQQQLEAAREAEAADPLATL